MSKEYYVLGQMEVKDYQAYLSTYGVRFKEILPKYNGEILAGTTKAEGLQGELFGNWTVLIKFPSKEDALGFYNSEEYTPLKKMQVTELTTGGHAFLFPAM